MTLKKTFAVGMSAALALGLAACSSNNSENAASSDSGTNYVLANGSEPQNPLIPANTNETGGGRIVDLIYSGLVYYDSEGQAHNELAESIELEGEKTYRITLIEGATFADGTAITAEHFVNTWNHAVRESLLNAYFFEPILGYEEGAESMEGLQVVDERTFTVELTQPESDFPTRLGYSAFYPLPAEALEDYAAFGENPVGNGPYKLLEWNHNSDLTIVPNENYDGPRAAQNDGVKFVFYASQDAAYADLLAGNLDVLDAVPDSAFSQFESELGDRAVNQPAAIFQSFTIPEKLEHFSGEEGVLRRQAISLAIDRNEVTDKIFQGTRTPATDFSSPVVDGYSDAIEGNDVLEFNPERARELWAQADAISPWSGEFTLSYNSDGGHQAWVDAVTNQLKNNLGIDAIGNPYPDFKSLRDDVTNRTISGAFRTGWQADYPLVSNFLVPLYATGASSNDGDYSNAEFDALLKEAANADSPEAGIALYQQAQAILMRELPSIPLWYSNVTGGSSEAVSGVVFTWKSVPEYQSITKS
ncbi:ABC transporter substrate-binding protein [Corynebacterium sp. 153RC1]|uniref:peptide ABC transporter substrate-binding protein n=1 Tax=unclassified Corynebacterium TaxID=2624378 RepID=UPI00211B8194|nr:MULTISPECIES: ABC transporter substrate-binding protein [unclassified Corynebacterium]MCQ9370378.1 ABC transporter substrate-binding protein [Corynebacterium sp. 35RC1]MCQ9351946.1 ABC transporter substrate-binding protein [Corynebacterium sp. 209RC1]MCQ9353695.1 ABC transporter substrate-binding protein [Corynebacterium sp. 1222RC1]MCQ9356321.1 ABC transporter substrate-binding protein [Corynebacterium sp. 122RC1]MCQ9358423.1 ABC transporter substrate-binding protein [Corynebacterium sp. 1